jgi:hypothetical protein
MHSTSRRLFTLLAMGALTLATGVRGADACPSVRPISRLLPGLAVTAAALPGPGAAGPSGPAKNSIVGLWQVTYTSGGSLWDMSFETWHDDGTEFENAMDSPLISAVCQGVWMQAGPKTVKLHHLGWNYDSTGTTLLGTFTLDQTNTLGPDGATYTGIFTFQPYDLTGAPVGPPTQGTVAATRVTVH